jgi:hypothetical protein
MQLAIINRALTGGNDYASLHRTLCERLTPLS